MWCDGRSLGLDFREGFRDGQECGLRVGELRSEIGDQLLEVRYSHRGGHLDLCGRQLWVGQALEAAPRAAAARRLGVLLAADGAP